MSKIFKVEQRTPEWHELRRGKITGTGLKKLLGGPKTKDDYFYEILAGRLSTAGVETESPMDRGIRLEEEAIQCFEKKSGKIVERVGFMESSWSRDVGCSPDGLIRKGKKYAEMVEVKCLSSGNHVKAWLTGKVPDEHEAQIVQAFIVNDDLKTMHMVFYDPRIEVKPYHVIKVERKEIEDRIVGYKKAQKEFLERINETLGKIIKL